jgi:hypothetical protein
VNRVNASWLFPRFVEKKVIQPVQRLGHGFAPHCLVSDGTQEILVAMLVPVHEFSYARLVLGLRPDIVKNRVDIDSNYQFSEGRSRIVDLFDRFLVMRRGKKMLVKTGSRFDKNAYQLSSRTDLLWHYHSW